VAKSVQTFKTVNIEFSFVRKIVTLVIKIVGKCTWLSVVALQRANEEQKQLMKECYGQKGNDSSLS
jgi:hypothetical protein